MSIAPLLGRGLVRARGQDVTETLQTGSWRQDAIAFDRRRWISDEVEIAWQASHHLIILTERGTTARTAVRLAGEPLFEGHDRAGALTFIPALADRVSSYRAADLTYSAFWIDPSLADELTGGPLPGLAPFVNGTDPLIRALVEALGQAMARGQMPGAAYVEHVAGLALLRLAGRPARGSLARAKLSRRACDRVIEHVEAHLEEDLSLIRLARVAGLPVDAFARRFKTTTGQTPYAFVISRRVARAEALLTGTDLPIGAIAASLGFAGQSHLTVTFRRATGLTPGAYRERFLPVF